VLIAVVFNLGVVGHFYGVVRASDKNIHNSRYYISYMEQLFVVVKIIGSPGKNDSLIIGSPGKNDFVCLTGNFRKGVVRLNWVAIWVPE